MLNMKLSCHVNSVFESVLTLGGSFVSSTTERIKHKKEIHAVWRRMTRVNNSVTYSFAQRHWMIRIAESPLRINTVTVRHIHIAKEPRDYQINRVVLIYKEPVFTRITLLCCIIHHIFFLNRVIRQFLINFMFIFCSYFYY